MLTIKKFIFSPFAVNSYILFDNTGECALIDPACYTADEEEQVREFIREKNLHPVRLLNTHGHLDHLFGNAFIKETYSIEPEFHQADQFLVDSATDFAAAYSLDFKPSPASGTYIDEKQTIRFGETQLKTLLVPGHSPGSIVFKNDENKVLLSGDVLFSGSIGRTDLPGGNYDQLIAGIKQKLTTLPDDFKILPGHGTETTIHQEKTQNVFLL